MRQQVFTPDAIYDDGGVLERQVAGDGIDFTAEMWRGQDAMAADHLRLSDGLLAWQMVTLDADTLAKAERCRIVVRCGVGYNNIDIAAAAALDLPVCNNPDYGTCEVADHSIAMLLALERGLIPLDGALRSSLTANFDHRLFLDSRRLSGLVLGLLGLGAIGTAVALRAKAFGMTVITYDPYLRAGQDLALGIERFEDRDALLARADVVSLHMPLTEQTANIIDARTLAQLKPGAILLNTARGGLVDLDAVHDALQDGRLRGAGLDVLPVEPPQAPFPRLLQAFVDKADWLEGRLLLTPHSAWSSVESRDDARTKAMATMRRFLETGELRNCVNAHLLTPGWQERRAERLQCVS